MITVYTKHLCGYCDMAKHYLRENNLEFTEINIDDNQNAREYMWSQGHRTAPQIYYNDKLLVEGGATGLLSTSVTELKERMGDLGLDDLTL
jgi:glutaredoxin-like protein NrdH